MESNGIHNSSCEFETEIVSYLYDEMATADRDRFETHLLECTPCTDEFAGMSYSRFSVFEWQREEFAPLTTPQIAIPYPAKLVEVSRSLGYFSGLRELRAFNWRSGVVAAGIFAICVGLGIAVLNSRVQTGNDVAAIDQIKKEIEVVSPIVPLTAPVIVKNIAEATIPESQKNSSVRAVHANSVVAVTKRAKVNKGQRLNTPRIGDDVAQQRSETVRRTALLLSTDADEDDRSLRLSDLFDEDDTRL